MTLKKLSIVSSAFLALASMANAALVNIATNTLASPARLVVTSTGAQLPTGSAVRIGVFQNGVVPVITPTTKVSDLTGFIPLGESAEANDGTNGPFGTTAATANGSGWQFTIQNVENTDTRFLSGTRLYIMVLNTLPGSTLNDATQLALLSDPGWTIPSAGTRAMTSAQVDSQVEVFYGTFSGATNQFIMGAINVPEPSVSGALLLAGLGMIARRRR